MEHPILVGLAVVGYLSGAVAWIFMIGGITPWSYGHRANCVGDMLTTLAWPVSMAVSIWLHLTEKGRR